MPNPTCSLEQIIKEAKRGEAIVEMIAENGKYAKEETKKWEGKLAEKVELKTELVF